MASVKEAIDVNVSVRTAYNQWTQFEDFPSFMEGVKKVTQLNEKRLFWSIEIGGKKKQWDAEISEQIPDKRIAWHSTTGARNAGVVTFHRISDTRTRVMVQMDYDPEGALETAGDALGMLSRRVRGDLDRFKKFIEKRGEETGAWRGKIRNPSERGKKPARGKKSTSTSRRVGKRSTTTRAKMSRTARPRARARTRVTARKRATR